MFGAMICPGCLMTRLGTPTSITVLPLVHYPVDFEGKQVLFLWQGVVIPETFKNVLFILTLYILPRRTSAKTTCLPTNFSFCPCGNNIPG